MESKLMSRRVYLDHNASTPVHPEVLAEMLPYCAEVYGNPSSSHAFGREAREGMDLARERVASFLKVSSQEIVFTSGGTESDNFAVKGLAWARGKGHLITSQVEHHAVIRACRAIEEQGFDLTCVRVDEFGMVDPDDVRRAIRPDTVAISIMHANSEVGTIQPIEAIGRIAREHGIPFHVDAVQTFGKLPVDVNGLGNAVEIRARDMHTEAERVTALRDRLWDGVRSRVPEVRLSGHPAHRLPGTASFLFRHVESESIVLGLDLKGIGVSAGSACTSGNVEPSHVLVAMGVPLEWAMGAVRCSLGRSTSAEDIDYVIECVEPLVRKLRQAMPVGVV